MACCEGDLANGFALHSAGTYTSIHTSPFTVLPALEWPTTTTSTQQAQPVDYDMTAQKCYKPDSALPTAPSLVTQVACTDGQGPKQKIMVIGLSIVQQAGECHYMHPCNLQPLCHPAGAATCSLNGQLLATAGTQYAKVHRLHGYARHDNWHKATTLQSNPALCQWMVQAARGESAATHG